MASPSFMRVADLVLRPDASRTVLRPFDPGDVRAVGPGEASRAQRITDRILALSEGERNELYETAVKTLSERHHDVDAVLQRRFDEIRCGTLDRRGATGRNALLIGAYFTEEFAFESTALFNPSAVIHPSQEGVAEGDTRFIMSLRAIGEGHVSSLTFRTGHWRANDTIELDEPSAYATGPQRLDRPTETKRTAELNFDPALRTSEMVVFPFLPSQGRGVEDMRLCLFTDDDGSTHYRGTFTAFDGQEVRQAMIRTNDFRSFVARGLDGDIARSKGMAWFPRRIDGRWWALGRQDNENVWVLSSDDEFTWSGGAKVIEPKAPWEFIQMGNCGSPIELDEGWLVLTHGVGDVRTYSMGASLLDKKDPTKLLARLHQPLLSPEADERSGYVPNVVYSCGALLRDRKLLLPYGVADQFSAFGVVDVDRLLECMS